MNVRELIDQLQMLGPEALESPVLISGPSGGADSYPAALVVPVTVTVTVVKSVTIG